MAAQKRARGGVLLSISRAFLDLLHHLKEEEHLSWAKFDQRYGMASSTWHEWDKELTEKGARSVESELLVGICRRLYEHRQLRPCDLGLPDATREALERLGASDDPLPEATETIRRCLIPFDAFIANRTREFVGRRFVFDAVRGFQEREASGYFMIEGEPGAGKSSILAQFVKDKGYICHFNIRSEGRNRVDQFLRNICAQLILRYHLPHPSLPIEATRDGEFFSTLLTEASRKVPAGERLVIAVDALDEVDDSTQPVATNILYLPVSLPLGVHFVLTTRRKKELRFTTQSPQDVIDLRKEYLDQSDEDIRLYIKASTERPRVRAWIDARRIADDDFIDVLAAKSNRNFMYISYVLPAIERGKYHSLDIKELPVGLEGYYEDHWRRMGMTADPLPRTKINIVYRLSVIGQPISRKEVANLSHVDELTVQEVIDEWFEFLHEDCIDGLKQYSIYHSSFQEFLYRKDIVQAAGVTVEDVSAELGNELFEAWQESKQQ